MRKKEKKRCLFSPILLPYQLVCSVVSSFLHSWLALHFRDLTVAKTNPQESTIYRAIMTNIAKRKQAEGGKESMMGWFRPCIGTHQLVQHTKTTERKCINKKIFFFFLLSNGNGWVPAPAK